MKSKKSPFKVKMMDDPVYNLVVWFGCGGTWEDVKNYIEKRKWIKKDDERYWGTGHIVTDKAFVLTIRGQGEEKNQLRLFVWIKWNRDFRALVHECAHLVFRIFDTHGIHCEVDNDEQFAYYLEFWVSTFWHYMTSPIKKQKRKHD
jgi:hypothetical protein